MTLGTSTSSASATSTLYMSEVSIGSGSDGFWYFINVHYKNLNHVVYTATANLTRLISSVFLVFPYRNPPAHGEDAGSRGGTGRSLLGVSAVQGLVHGPGR